MHRDYGPSTLTTDFEEFLEALGQAHSPHEVLLALLTGTFVLAILGVEYGLATIGWVLRMLQNFSEPRLFRM